MVSHQMDVVKVENGQMTHMYDMKFPGDKPPNAPDKDLAYRTFARQQRAQYKEFIVLDECDECAESVRQRELEREWQAEANRRQLMKALEDAPLLWWPGRRIPGGRRPAPSW